MGQDKMKEVEDANEKLHQRNQELFEEAIELRKEVQSLKVRLTDKERDLKAYEDRYLKLMKDTMSAGSAPTKPVSGEVRPNSNTSTQPPESASAPAATKGYEDDFDEHDGT